MYLPPHSSFISVLCVCRTALICYPGLLCWSMFVEDVVGCFSHGSVKIVDHSVYFGVLIVIDE